MAGRARDGVNAEPLGAVGDAGCKVLLPGDLDGMLLEPLTPGLDCGLGLLVLGEQRGEPLLVGLSALQPFGGALDLVVEAGQFGFQFADAGRGGPEVDLGWPLPPVPAL